MSGSRYTIRMEIVRVDDNGEATDTIFADMLEWATTDRRLIFAEANFALSTLNENTPSSATMRAPNPTGDTP